MGNNTFTWVNTKKPVDPGHVLGHSTTNPPAPAQTAQALPVTIPATGALNTSDPRGFFLTLMVALGTYGAVYFAQSRRTNYERV